jgi:hypothetical protein
MVGCWSRPTRAARPTSGRGVTRRPPRDREDSPPLDYVGAGSATTADLCTAVAIGANGMYAVGRQGSTTGDSDAVILKF